MALISVIIPVYNGEKTIRETIESVLNQTFSDFELIVINDGSQDLTLDIIANIEDTRLKIFSYPNAGQAVSRNRGFSHASGEFIAFLDADDLWIPDKLESQLKALQEHPNAAVAYSWTNFIDEMGHYLCNSSNRTVNGDAYAELLLYNFLDSGSNPLIRRQALAQVGGFDKELVPAEDWDMYLRLAARYHFVAVPLPQILYRVSTNSQSTNVSKLEAVSVMVLEQAYKRAPKSLQDIKKQSFANLYDYLIFKSIGGFSDRKRNWEAIKLFWNYIRKKPRLYRIVPKLFLFKTVVRSLFHSS
jgi:glycosyltransferase involved in cell wall biosynthesis